ncbi:hypothetical protein [Sorangium sp. So ce385]|uniref:hypothetical protein n=1 Tax=Sorangium sp. So ce385 TaxID=3133308 RepID=UPI003F5C1DDC
MERMIIVTFDLKTADKGDYDRAYEVLRSAGLHPVSPEKQLDLPRTTVMGMIDTNASAELVRDALWKALENAGLTPSRMLSGFLDGWGVKATVE